MGFLTEVYANLKYYPCEFFRKLTGRTSTMSVEEWEAFKNKSDAAFYEKALRSGKMTEREVSDVKEFLSDADKVHAGTMSDDMCINRAIARGLMSIAASN